MKEIKANDSANVVIKRAMEALKVDTQAELGAILGVTQGAIADAKRKDRVPHEWVVKLAREKKISPDWLLAGRGPMNIVFLDYQRGDTFGQMSFLLQSISRVAELIEIRGSSDPRNKPIGYIVLWKNEDPQFIHTDLNADRPHDETVVDFIRKSYLAAGILVKYIDADKKYFPFAFEEENQIELIDGLESAEGNSVDVLTELEEYIKTTGNVVRVVEDLTTDFDFSMSQMLTMASKILESKTIYTSALVSSIKALHKAVIDDELGHDR